MTAHDGYLSQGAFKDEFHDPMGYPYFAAPQSQPKQQRQEESRSCSPPDDTANCSEQLPTRPVEEYPFFAAIVRLEDGTLQMRSSRDLKRFKEYILEEAQVKLANVMDEFIGAPEPLKHQLGPKRSPTTTSMRDNRLVPYPSKPGKHRNHAMYSNPERGSFLRSERKIETRQPNRGERQIQMQVDDREAQEKWFGDAFKAVQQVGCRTIAKVWIKKIHPKKQSTHPYNGGVPKHEQQDPNRTRPPYWPQHVIHKEPDHIDRTARTNLLVHLIMNTPQRQIKSNQEPPETFISAHDLWDALEEKKGDFKPDRWAIIREIIKAREQIEVYEVGGIDHDAVIHVPDFSETARNARGEGDGDAEDSDVPASNDNVGTDDNSQIKDTEVTPTPSSAQTSTELTTPLYPQTSRTQPKPSDDLPRSQCEQLITQHDLELSQSSGADIPPLHTITHHLDPKTSLGAASLQRFRSQHELQSLQTQSDRQQDNALVPQWLPSVPPPDYLLGSYPTNSIQPQAPISSQTFRMAEIALMQNHRQDMNIAVDHGLSLFEPYQDFVHEMPKSLPARAMSDPHQSRNLHNMPQTFF